MPPRNQRAVQLPAVQPVRRYRLVFRQGDGGVANVRIGADVTRQRAIKKRELGHRASAKTGKLFPPRPLGERIAPKRLEADVIAKMRPFKQHSWGKKKRVIELVYERCGCVTDTHAEYLIGRRLRTDEDRTIGY